MAEQHNWRGAWTVHGADSRWVDWLPSLTGDRAGSKPALLLLPLLSASASLDVRAATRCGVPFVSVAAAGTARHSSAIPMSRIA